MKKLLTLSTLIFVLCLSIPAIATAQFVIESGNNQTGDRGNQLANDFVVRWKDASGGTNPFFSANGHTVNWAITQGTGASLSATSTTTDSNGRARTKLTLGSASGTYQVTATLIISGFGHETVAGTKTFTATAVAPGYVIHKIGGDNQTSPNRTELNDLFAIKLTDDDGQLAINRNVTFTIIEKPQGSTGASLSVTEMATSRYGSAGTRLTLGNMRGTYKVIVSTDRADSVTFTATANGVDTIAPAFPSDQMTFALGGLGWSPRNLIKATDETEGDRLTYSLGGTDASSFDFAWDYDLGAGILKKEGVDYNETSYSVTITATDKSGNTDTVAVTIKNENISFTALDGNSAAPGNSLMFEVKIVDSNSDGVSGKRVTFSVSPTTGVSVKPTSGRTNSDGILQAKLRLWNDASGVYMITAECILTQDHTVVRQEHVYVTPETSEADALPPVSSEEAARLISLLQMDRVIINEIFNASNDMQDWVELQNISDTDVDLAGWQLIVSTSQGSQSVTLPIGTVLPAGELLLLRNTRQYHTNMSLETVPEDVSSLSVIDPGFVLPQVDFMLLLRSPTAWEDNAGNYFFGYETSVPAPTFTLDTAWSRIKPNTPGSRAEAWAQDGLGTPGYHREMFGDLNGDATVNIQDLVIVASKFGQSGETGADLNNDGTVNIQDLVLVANAMGGASAAPSAHTLTAAQVDQWLQIAKTETTLSQPDIRYQQGIQVLEQLRQSLLPKTTALLPNYPNPFNPETWIPYHLAKPADVSVSIYAADGKLVRTLDLGHQTSGIYKTRSRAAYWDGKNALGESVASGVYFYMLTAGDFSATRRMLILK